MAIAATNRITQIERRDAAADAVASLRLEGLQPSPAMARLMERYVRGELTLDGFTSAARQQVLSLTKGREHDVPEGS
jgi:hypothetical protein